MLFSVAAERQRPIGAILLPKIMQLALIEALSPTGA